MLICIGYSELKLYAVFPEVVMLAELVVRILDAAKLDDSFREASSETSNSETSNTVNFATLLTLKC